jgi:hypothetical protein
MKPLRYVMLVLMVFLCGCGGPYVEEVRYTDYSNRYKNYLQIIVNTRELSHGKGGILRGYDRCDYSFSMTTKSNQYTQSDMEITISPETTEGSFRPKAGLVTISKSGSGSILVSVRIEDARVPKLINGAYTLSAAETTADHVWYKTK